MAGVSEIIDRHKSECEFIRKLIDESLQHRSIDAKKAVEMMEFAKLFAETVTILQASERFIYNIDDSSIELVGRAEEELKKRLAG